MLILKHAEKLLNKFVNVYQSKANPSIRVYLLVRVLKANNQMNE